MAATVETRMWLALKARIATITGYITSQFAWPMDPFTPPQSNGKPLPYLDIAHMPNVNARVLVGSKGPMRRPGIVQIALMWPVSEIGTAPGKTHPDVLIQKVGAVAAHFPTDLCMAFQGVSVRVTKAPDVAQPIRDDAYWRVPVSIFYETYA